MINLQSLSFISLLFWTDSDLSFETEPVNRSTIESEPIQVMSFNIHNGHFPSDNLPVLAEIELYN